MMAPARAQNGRSGAGYVLAFRTLAGRVMSDVVLGGKSFVLPNGDVPHGDRKGRNTADGAIDGGPKSNATESVKVALRAAVV
jgi:hypothetical protein